MAVPLPLTRRKKLPSEAFEIFAVFGVPFLTLGTRTFLPSVCSHTCPLAMKKRVFLCPNSVVLRISRLILVILLASGFEGFTGGGVGEDGRGFTSAALMSDFWVSG